MRQALFQDLRYAMRSLRRAETFAAAALLTLALGIGLTTAVTRLVLDQVVKVTIVGIVAGTALGLTLAEGLRGFLYGITPADPMTLGGVVMLLCGVVAASSVLTVRRARGIQPVTALRGE